MTVLNIVYQIDPAYHHAQGEQYIIRNIDAAGETHITVEPYADLSAAEKTEYDDLKAVYDTYLPAGKNAVMTVIQIDPVEHNSEERAVICYDDAGEIKRVFVNYADLSAGDKTKYDNLKAQASGKAPA